MTEKLKKDIKKYLRQYDNEFGKPEIKDDYYTWNEEAYLLLEKVLEEEIK